MGQFLTWLSNLTRPRVPTTEEIAETCYREMQKLPDEAGVADLLDGAIKFDMLNRTELDVGDMREIMASLTPRQQAALHLNLDGMTYKQIAAALGVTDEVALRELTHAMHVMRWQGMR